MRRTTVRILASHSVDLRFEFLCGRWSRVWRLTKGKAHLDLEAEAEKRQEAEDVKAEDGVDTGGLTRYGDSDGESEAGGDELDAAVAEPQRGDGEVLEVSNVAGPAPVPGKEVKAARRMRVTMWAEKRRAAKEVADARGDYSWRDTDTEPITVVQG